MDDSLTILETERLRLRGQQAADIPDLVDLWSDSRATEFMGGPRDRNDLKNIFEQTARNPWADKFDLWPVELKQTGQLVGHCGLLDKEIEGQEEIELIYVLTPSAWGNGYATEIAKGLRAYAFDTMNLPRLIALIAPENAGSEKVALKIGMTLEREIIRPGGAIRKVYVARKEDMSLRRS